MTQTSRPWTGRTSEGAAGDAGSYSAQNWQDVWQAWFGQNKANRGVLRGVDNELQVVASSPPDANVNVSTGAAQVAGIWYLNNASVPVAIASNSSGSTRIDVIVLTADYTAQTVRVAVVQGTPAAGIPALTQTALIYQIPLAYLTLASGFASIANSAITDMREYANIPANLGVDVTNSSGAALDSGSAVIWLAAGGAAINTSTTEGDRNIAGVVEGRIANGATGRIITQGIVSVICDEAVSVGELIELSTTAGQAQGAVKGGILGRVLTANTGAGTKSLVYINILADVPTVVTGQYNGDGNATQAVTVAGIGFIPRRVAIHTTTATQPAVNLAEKTDQDGVNAMLMGQNAGGFAVAYGADQIISLDFEGFTVGDGTPVAFNFLNAAGRTYIFTLWP